jgi:hypothetical protein
MQKARVHVRGVLPRFELEHLSNAQRQTQNNVSLTTARTHTSPTIPLPESFNNGSLLNSSSPTTLSLCPRIRSLAPVRQTARTATSPPSLEADLRLSASASSPHSISSSNPQFHPLRHSWAICVASSPRTALKALDGHWALRQRQRPKPRFQQVRTRMRRSALLAAHHEH